MSVTDDA